MKLLYLLPCLLVSSSPLFACSSSSAVDSTAADAAPASEACEAGTTTATGSCADYLIAWCGRTSTCCLSSGICDARCSFPDGTDYCSMDHCLKAVGQDRCKLPGMSTWRVCSELVGACDNSLAGESCDAVLSGAQTPECATWANAATPR